MAWESYITFTNANVRTVSFDFNKYQYRLRNPNNNKSDLYRLGVIVKEMYANSVNALNLGDGGLINGNNDIYLHTYYADIYLERELKNTAPTTPGAFTSPASGTVLKGGQTVNVAWGASTDAEGNAITYEFGNRFYVSSSQTWTGWSSQWVSANNLNYTILTNKDYIRVEHRVRARDSNGADSAFRYSEIYTITHNAAPTLTLTTVNNQTLNENDVLNITGDATDTDNGNAVTVKYKINSGTTRNVTSALSNGTTPIAFSKGLMLKNGRLYDGTTEITGDLAEGTGHVLSVWAEDDQGGISSTQTRTFYITLNRPPALTIDSFAPTSDLINNDTVTVTGTVSDADNNQVTVSFAVNDGAYTQIYSGLGSAFSFDFSVRLLKVGANTVKVKAVDSYNFETVKTITFDKAENNVPLTQSEVRYQVLPPNGQAKGFIVWIERDDSLNIEAYASIVDEGAPDNYVPMTWNQTANISAGIVEDEYGYQVETPLAKVSLKVVATGGTGSIKLITGVLS